MARIMTECPSKCEPITEIMQSDGSNRVPVAKGQWSSFYEFGCQPGNVVSVRSHGVKRAYD
jgi:hypothetical protein